MLVDHERAPLIEAIRDYREEGWLSFIIPGHKHGRGLDPTTASALGADAFVADVSLGGGVEDHRVRRDLLGEAERLAAAAFGSDRCFFQVSGSSQANQIALLSVVGPDDEVIIARNVHKSVQAALVLSGSRPIYLIPRHDPVAEVAHGVTADDLVALLDARPTVKAVAIVSPTYFGVSSDLPALVEICHGRGIPLVVDEAWGGHFAFHPDFPSTAMSSGADVSVTSIHKMLTGFGQAAVVNVQGNLVDPDRVALWTRLLQTTSPSATILASIDGCRRQMMLYGESLLARTLDLAAMARAEINAIPGLHALDAEILERPGVVAFDPTKLVIDVYGAGWSGYAAEMWLRENAHIALEMRDHRRIVATITIGDDAETVGVLLDGLRALAAAPPPTPLVRMPSSDPAALQTESVLTPRDAAFAPSEHVPLSATTGRIAADIITPYPPGIPILAPGERITPAIVSYLEIGLAAGMQVTGITNPDVPTLNVVA